MTINGMLFRLQSTGHLQTSKIQTKLRTEIYLFNENNQKIFSTQDTGHWTMFMIENLIDLLLQELGLSEAVLV